MYVKSRMFWRLWLGVVWFPRGCGFGVSFMPCKRQVNVWLIWPLFLPMLFVKVSP